jgi:hypothetical protein
MSKFVTFEIGKKLKEKGFIHDYNIYGYKPIYTDVNTIALIWNNGAYEKDYFGENIPCPTISEVLEWLRDEKKLYILPNDILIKGNIKWDVQIDDLNTSNTIHESRLIYTSFEEASLVGINYVLDNLI